MYMYVYVCIVIILKEKKSTKYVYFIINGYRQIM